MPNLGGRGRACFLVFLVIAAAACGDGAGGGDASVPVDTGPIDPAQFRAMTFNVLCSFCDMAGYDSWQQRLPHIDAAIRRYDPDLLGTQELFNGNEVKRFLAEHPKYDAVYYIDPGTPGAPLRDYPDAALFYRKRRFEVVESGVYWLSPTPDDPWTTGFASVQIFRLVTWSHLRQKSDGRDLYVAVTHFDNNSPSQEKSAPLVVTRTAPWIARMPVLLLGDFNSKPDSVAYATLAGTFGNTFDLAPSWRADTNLDPAPAYDAKDRIDHLFVAGHPFVVRDWIVDTHAYGTPPRYPADHFPMIANLAW